MNVEGKNVAQATWWLGDSLNTVMTIQGEPTEIKLHQGRVVELLYASRDGTSESSSVNFVANQDGLLVAYRFNNEGDLHAQFPLADDSQDTQPNGWWIGSSKKDVARLEGASPIGAFINKGYLDQGYWQEVWQYPGEEYPGNRSDVRFDREGLVVEFSNSGNQLHKLMHPDLQHLKYGDTYERVLAIQGPPVEIRSKGNHQTWYYAHNSFDRCTTIEFENGVVVNFCNDNGLLKVPRQQERISPRTSFPSQAESAHAEATQVESVAKETSWVHRLLKTLLGTFTLASK